MVRYNGWIYSGYICSWMREHKPTCTVTGSAPSCTWATMFYWAFVYFFSINIHMFEAMYVYHIPEVCPGPNLPLQWKTLPIKWNDMGWCQNTDETCVLVYVYKITYNIHICSLYIILYPHWPTTPHKAPVEYGGSTQISSPPNNIFCTFLTNTLVNWHVVLIFVGWLTSKKSNDPHLA